MLAREEPRQVLDTALNALVELTEQAARCRRLASTTHDRDVARMLGAMAVDYEQAAAALERR